MSVRVRRDLLGLVGERNEVAANVISVGQREAAKIGDTDDTPQGIAIERDTPAAAVRDAGRRNLDGVPVGVLYARHTRPRLEIDDPLVGSGQSHALRIEQKAGVRATVEVVSTCRWCR